MKIFIIVTSDFAAYHCWKDCPFPAVDFLKHKHRHKFFVKLKLRVHHHDREKEFFLVKAKLNNLINKKYSEKDLGSKSCEMLAREIGSAFVDVRSVQVWEDNENGAEVVYED